MGRVGIVPLVLCACGSFRLGPRPRRVRRLTALVLVAAASLLAFGAAGAQAARFHSDPAPTLSTTGSISVLHKELDAYPNYGVRDRAADIVYSGESACWHFDRHDAPGTHGDAAQFVLSLALDDHYGRPASDYVGTIKVNDQTTSGHVVELGVQHGVPFGSVFTNWKTVSFPVFGLHRHYVLCIQNMTPGPVGDDWIAVDWIELQLIPVLKPPGSEH